MRTTPLLLTGLLLTGCATMNTSPSSPPETAQKALTQPSAAEQSVLQADRDFNAATQAKGVDGWVSFFDEHGSMLLPDGPATGHEAVRAAMADAFASPDFSLTWEPTHGEVTPGGKLGYTIGRYVMKGKHNGQAFLRTGTYISVWRKQADGSWKAIADVGDPDPAPAPAAPAKPATP